MAFGHWLIAGALVAVVAGRAAGGRLPVRVGGREIMGAVLRWLTAGESHGPALVAVLEGLPAGVR